MGVSSVSRRQKVIRGLPTPDQLLIMDSESGQSKWRACGSSMPKAELVFFSQILVLYIVIVTCIVNLSIGNGDSNLWTALLSSSLGYILPNPSLKRKKPFPPAPSQA